MMVTVSVFTLTRLRICCCSWLGSVECLTLHSSAKSVAGELFSELVSGLESEPVRWTKQRYYMILQYICMESKSESIATLSTILCQIHQILQIRLGHLSNIFKRQQSAASFRITSASATWIKRHGSSVEKRRWLQRCAELQNLLLQLGLYHLGSVRKILHVDSLFKFLQKGLEAGGGWRKLAG